MSEEKPKIHIDSCGWGNVVIDGQKFDQVIISGEKVIRREVEKLENLFGTTHQIGDWEIEELLSGNPETIILSSGQGGVMEISQEVKEKLASSGAEIKILLTPQAVSEFNKLSFEGKRVNALIHTTC